MWRKQTHDLSNLNFHVRPRDDVRINTVFCRNRKYVYQTPLKLSGQPLLISDIFSLTKTYLII